MRPPHDSRPAGTRREVLPPGGHTLTGILPILALTALALGACDDGVGVRLIEIDISPAGASVSGVGATTQFAVSGWDSEGYHVPSPSVIWSTLNPNVAVIDASTGVATAVASGQVTVAAEFDVPAVAMHNQRDREFHDVIGDITEGLVESLRIARQRGLPDERVIVDPGFNFGWTEDQALEMLRRLGELRTLGRPLLVGTSRKSTIGVVLGLPVEDRLEGTAATVAVAIANGADIVRVHDVREMSRVARMADAVVRGWTKSEART